MPASMFADVGTVTRDKIAVVAVQVVTYVIVDGGGAAAAVVHVALGGSVELLGTIDACDVAAAVVRVVQLGSGEYRKERNVHPAPSAVTDDRGEPDENAGSGTTTGALSTERRAGGEARKADLCERNNPGGRLAVWVGASAKSAGGGGMVGLSPSDLRSVLATLVPLSLRGNPNDRAQKSSRHGVSPGHWLQDGDEEDLNFDSYAEKSKWLDRQGKLECGEANLKLTFRKMALSRSSLVGHPLTGSPPGQTRARLKSRGAAAEGRTVDSEPWTVGVLVVVTWTGENLRLGLEGSLRKNICVQFGIWSCLATVGRLEFNFNVFNAKFSIQWGVILVARVWEKPSMWWLRFKEPPQNTQLRKLQFAFACLVACSNTAVTPSGYAEVTLAPLTPCS
ncbi:hypothetical protein EDB85DRAFT_1891216 [Lactarius pseudohatsudake]|nr:hypothetical protein EDB85DRAFT_1891216 [Lactarius pseudohatsudake]